MGLFDNNNGSFFGVREILLAGLVANLISRE